MPASCLQNTGATMLGQAFPHRRSAMLRALFVGGVVDNSEMDMDGPQPPVHYPENGHTGRPRYKLHLVGKQDQAVIYAVYGAPDLADGEIERVAEERGYARRFDTKAEIADA
jgi:hypothetical protein